QAEHVWHIPLGPDRQPLHADHAVAKPEDTPSDKPENKPDNTPTEQTDNKPDNTPTEEAKPEPDSTPTEHSDAKPEDTPTPHSETPHAEAPHTETPADHDSTAPHPDTPTDDATNDSADNSTSDPADHPSDESPTDHAPTEPEHTPADQVDTTGPEHAPTDHSESPTPGDSESTPKKPSTSISQYLAKALSHDSNPLIYGKPSVETSDDSKGEAATQAPHQEGEAAESSVSSPPPTTPNDGAVAPTSDHPADQHALDAQHHDDDDHHAPEEPSGVPEDTSEERSSLAERRNQAEDILGPTAARVLDLDSWLQFHEKKADVEFEQTLNEMREARRLLEENPDHVLHTALELNAPVSPNNEALAEFDLGLAEPNGPINRRVEVTTVEREIEKPGDIRNAVAHGFDKINKREAHGFPLPRPRDVSIYLKVKAEIKSKKGLTTERGPDGSVKLSRPDGTLIRERNLFDDILDNLNKTPDASKLDRIICSDPDLGVLAEYVHNGTSWERIR
ncbi:hypothetical protein AB0C96_30595, partial [Streptomyces sp. NPDC048506]